MGISSVQLSRIETGASGIGKETLDKAIEILKLNQIEAYEKAGILNPAKIEVEKDDDTPDLSRTVTQEERNLINVEWFLRLGGNFEELTQEEQQEYGPLLKQIAENVERRVQRRKN